MLIVLIPLALMLGIERLQIAGPATFHPAAELHAWWAAAFTLWVGWAAALAGREREPLVRLEHLGRRALEPADGGLRARVLPGLAAEAAHHDLRLLGGLRQPDRVLAPELGVPDGALRAFANAPCHLRPRHAGHHRRRHLAGHAAGPRTGLAAGLQRLDGAGAAATQADAGRLRGTAGRVAARRRRPGAAAGRRIPRLRPGVRPLCLGRRLPARKRHGRPPCSKSASTPRAACCAWSITRPRRRSFPGPRH